MITRSLNDWYCISVITYKDIGSSIWFAIGDIYRRDNNELVDKIYGYGSTEKLAEQNTITTAFNIPVLTVLPMTWHPLL